MNFLVSVPQPVIDNFNYIFYGLLGAVALIGALVGAKEKFSKMKWGAIALALTTTAWILFTTKYKAYNPIEKIKIPEKLAESETEVKSLLTLVFSALSTAFVLGFIGLFCNHNPKKTTSGGVLDSLFGAVFGATQGVIVFACVLGSALWIMQATKFNETVLQDLYTVERFQTGMTYIKDYAFGILLTSVLLGVAYGGSGKSTAGNIGSFIKWILGLGILVLAFYIPITGNFYGSFLTEKCDTFFAKILTGSFTAMISTASKITVGIGILIVGLIIVNLLCLPLKIKAKSNTPSKLAQSIGFVVFLILGTVLIGLIAFLFVTLEKNGIFANAIDYTKLYTEKSTVFNALKSILTKYVIK